MSDGATASKSDGATVWRLGSVSYLNSKPLIWGLESARDLRVMLEVPSRLAGLLGRGECDVALLPVIDYQRMPGLRIVPSGGIACDGPTLTVRIFSNRPIKTIRSLACDPDSHTSVALARVVLAEWMGIRPEIVELDMRSGRQCDAQLLIGDKVVCEEPAGLEHQLDLGWAWKQMTGLPFVFAVWTAREGIELGDLPKRLSEAKAQGLAHVEEIVNRYAVPRGWPAGIAMQYLTAYLGYEITDRHLEAIRRFHELAGRHGLLDGPVRELVVAKD
jgi:chorismate dehydratase